MGGGKGKNEMLLDVWGFWTSFGELVLVSECSRRPIFFLFIKENWILATTRHHANNILLTRNLHFDSDFRK